MLNESMMRTIKDLCLTGANSENVATTAVHVEPYTVKQIGDKYDDLFVLSIDPSIDYELTPKEYTLKLTGGKYDTIFVQSLSIAHPLKRRFGANLNIIESNVMPAAQIILYDSRKTLLKLLLDDFK